MKLNNFNTIYATAEALYGINTDPEDLEEIALIGWGLIGNKHTRLYRYVTDTTHRRIELPCNAVYVESVTAPILDANTTSSIYDGIDFGAQSTEAYAEAHKINNPTIYSSGKLIKYRQEGENLVFDRDYNNICIIYHGVIVDEDGLPYLNDKELYALANYVAYSVIYKKALMTKDGGLVQLAGVIKADWLKSCTAARVSEYLNQNDMDAIADVRTRWDRKIFGKSFKPIV